jgi:O-antigen/teichoic acid export membrane protein
VNLHPVTWLRNRFVRDAATLQVAGMINQASQLASAVALAFLLGAHGQGLYVSAISLQALFYFMISVGVAQATTSQIAAAAARDNEYKSSGWVTFMAKAVLLFGTLLLIGGALILPTVGERLYGSREVGVWAAWLCAQPLLELPRVVAMVSFQGTRRMFFLGQVENGHELVRFFLVILGATITGSAEGAIIGTLGASVIGSILASELYREARKDGGHPLPSARQIVARMREVKVRQGIRQGVRVAFLKNGQSLFGTVFPRLIIGVVAGVSWVTYFHIAHRIMMVPMMLALGVSRTLLPALGELAGKKDIDRFRTLFVKATLITGSLIAVCELLLLALVPWMVTLLFPEDYVRPVFTFAAILVIGYIPYGFGSTVESFYIVANRIKALLVITLIGAVITIPTNVWLILTVPYTGTAWGLSLYQSWTVVHLVYAAWFFRSVRRGGGVWGGAAASTAPEGGKEA